MKKVLIAMLAFGALVMPCTAQSIALKQRVQKLFNDSPLSKITGKSEGSKINKPSRIEASAGTYTSQVVIEFVYPLFFQKNEIKQGEAVEIDFPGIDEADFKALGLVAKIKELPIVKDVSLSMKKLPIPHVVLSISFNKDEVVLRLTKSDDPNLLIIDIFEKKLLEELAKKVTTTLYAYNNVLLQNDSVPCVCANDGFLEITKKKRNFSAHKANIIIDAGHGGDDDGAMSFGLKEKDLTLSIARKIYSRLKKEGYRVFLTRNTDTTLSVVDRFELAQQLKADLFVSIHVNSAGCLEQVSGVETHFLDESPFSPQQGKSQFVFVASNNDQRLTQVANALLQEKITCSKLLSESIQTNLLESLEKKEIVFINRGVKRTGFRTLLRHEVPAAIVEVGFITNKKEAKRLTNQGYQSILAKGICNGIKKFLAC